MHRSTVLRCMYAWASQPGVTGRRGGSAAGRGPSWPHGCGMTVRIPRCRGWLPRTREEYARRDSKWPGPWPARAGRRGAHGCDTSPSLRRVPPPAWPAVPVKAKSVHSRPRRGGLWCSVRRGRARVHGRQGRGSPPCARFGALLVGPDDGGAHRHGPLAVVVGGPLPHVVSSGRPAGVIGVGSVRFSGAVVHSMPPRRGASQATGVGAVPSGAMARRMPRRPVAESVTMWPSHGWERCIRPVAVTTAPREEPVPAPFDEEARSDVWGDMVVAFPSRPGRERVERRQCLPDRCVRIDVRPRRSVAATL
ncbi:hypothetical protein SRB17_25990 [Streptomyces sp. RB17]|nr:hypothetical protein [Streptomyces sp. RB17]